MTMPLAAFPKCFVEAIHRNKSMTLDQWIDISLQIDLDGLEFYWPITPRDPREWDRLRRRVESNRRTIPMLCYSPDFTQPDPEERKREIQQQKNAIQAAAGLGARYCRVLSGQRRPGISPDQGLTWVGECLEVLLPFASEHGVVLVLENHYKDGLWEYPEFAQSKELFLKLLDAIPESDWFGVNFDPSNAIIAGDDPIDWLHAVKHRVKTMHASDRYLAGGNLDDLRRMEKQPSSGYASILKHGVIGQGLNDYGRIFETLCQAGFNGWISIEDGEDAENGIRHLQQSARFLRKKMKYWGLD